MGVKGKWLSKNGERRSNTPNKFYSIVLWKTQNQQNKNLKNGNLVALKRSSASRMPKKFFIEKNFMGSSQPSFPVGMPVLNRNISLS
jgi:hypothetical protein